MNDSIEKIYDAGFVTGRSGKAHKLHSAIDREEGKFITSLIENDPAIKHTLEIGCAYGLSSLYICSALSGRSGAQHTIIDPFQNTDWDGVGVKQLEEFGIDFFELIELRSEFALPKLLEFSEGTFDLILVDGYHTFDHTLLDCFFATRLLRIGGVLVIDDVAFPSVRRVVAFLQNYPCYEQIGSVQKNESKAAKRATAGVLSVFVKPNKWANVISPRLYRKLFELSRIEMIALKKIAEDERSWDWHSDAF
jgi:predicted O-methyltransferase YrrM